eukprot:scaffold208535_cov14-Tisochrysis_lutea.AAC.1
MEHQQDGGMEMPDLLNEYDDDLEEHQPDGNQAPELMVRPLTSPLTGPKCKKWSKNKNSGTPPSVSQAPQGTRPRKWLPTNPLSG